MSWAADVERESEAAQLEELHRWAEERAAAWSRICAMMPAEIVAQLPSPERRGWSAEDLAAIDQELEDIRTLAERQLRQPAHVGRCESPRTIWCDVRADGVFSRIAVYGDPADTLPALQRLVQRLEP